MRVRQRRAGLAALVDDAGGRRRRRPRARASARATTSTAAATCSRLELGERDHGLRRVDDHLVARRGAACAVNRSGAGVGRRARRVGRRAPGRGSARRAPSSPACPAAAVRAARRRARAACGPRGPRGTGRVSGSIGSGGVAVGPPPGRVARSPATIVAQARQRVDADLRHRARSCRMSALEVGRGAVGALVDEALLARAVEEDGARACRAGL